MSAARANNTLAVLVHGAWHSSIHWAATHRELARRGIAGIAIDLPGHGIGAPVPSGYLSAGQPGLTTEKSALADITMEDLSGAILDVLGAARGRFERVILVAHSASGGPTSLAAERAPDLVDRLVYLAAGVPAGRPRHADYAGGPENADAVALPFVAEPTDIGAYRLNYLSPEPTEIETIRQAFLNDLPGDASESWRLLLHPDEPCASLTAPVRLTRQRWGRIPRTYIRLTDDQALSPAAQDAIIAETDESMPDTPFDVRSLPGGHSPMITRPAELANLLADVVTKPQQL
ncbi:alpha/beta fold hydrolase [Mycolicibacterium goodii]|uniref:alpha/beta fold hydrolase n=1 Tax=Mycolicibacterium goodii TaxID=134601 RepID=UPI001BDD75DA|nr:alpha/beta fold hydrolase [Mycolicibacterium goodii]MBU8807409.1 alpha/beta fold hydrolase [Mycolicibacterium goodii]